MMTEKVKSMSGEAGGKVDCGGVEVDGGRDEIDGESY